jgi:hypothetical protein
MGLDNEAPVVGEALRGAAELCGAVRGDAVVVGSAHQRAKGSVLG